MAGGPTAPCASSTRSTRPTARATGTPTTTRRASTAGEEPRGLDKEYVRRTLAEQGYRGEGPPPPLTDEVRCEAARRYIALYELITGKPFVPDTEEPHARIRKSLAGV